MVGIGAVLALVEATQVYVGFAVLGNPIAWTLALLSTVPSWAVLVALVLPTLRVLDRVPGPGGARRLVGLTVGGVVFTSLHLAGTALLGDLLLPASPGFRAHFVQLASVYFVAGLFTFVAVVAVHDTARRYRDEGRRRVSEARVEADVAEARLVALRGQLRPDFFFNTLNAATGLVARGDAQRSAEVLAGLGRLLRSSLTVEPGRPSTVAEEVSLVQDYLAIQHLRFPDRLEIGRHDLGRSASRSVPAFLLVQLAELVVDAGLRRGAPFMTRLAARVEQGRLLLVIEHTGPEIDSPALADVRRRLARVRTGGTLEEGPGAVRVSLPEAFAERAVRRSGAYDEEER